MPSPSLNLKAAQGTPSKRPTIAPHARPYVIKGVEKRIEHKFAPSLPQAGFKLASDTNFTVDNIIPVRTSDNKIKFVHGVGQTRARKLHFGPPEGFDLSRLPIRGEKRFEVSHELKKLLSIDDSPEVVLPTAKKAPKIQPQVKLAKKIVTLPQKTVKVAKSTHPLASEGERVIKPTFNIQRQTAAAFAPQHHETTPPQPTQTTIASPAHIIPLTDTPNVISGLVTDQQGVTISGAVMVIRDSMGIPVRALKTNKLGQFLSATPLSPGHYTLETESELAKFNPLSFEAKGAIIAPIEVRASGGN